MRVLLQHQSSYEYPEPGAAWSAFATAAAREPREGEDRDVFAHGQRARSIAFSARSGGQSRGAIVVSKR